LEHTRNERICCVYVQQLVTLLMGPADSPGGLLLSASFEFGPCESTSKRQQDVAAPRENPISSRSLSLMVFHARGPLLLAVRLSSRCWPQAMALDSACPLPSVP
jgi:hypothetical protein